MRPEDVEQVELSITNKCSLKCPHCDSVRHYNLYEAAAEHLDVSAVQEFLDQLPNLQTVRLEGAYSDQTSHPDMLDVVRYCKKRGVRVLICTHGSARNTKWWLELASLLDGDDLIRFAIDGSVQEIHGKYRVNSKLERVLQNHQIVKTNSKVQTLLQHIVFQFNEHDTDNVRALAREHNFNTCEVIPCGQGAFTNEMRSQGLVPSKDVLKTYDTIDAALRNMERCVGEVKCDSRAQKEIYINHRGEAYMCADYDKADSVQDINIINSNVYAVLNHLTETLDEKTCYASCNPLSYNVGLKHPFKIYDSSNNEQIVHFHMRDSK